MNVPFEHIDTFDKALSAIIGKSLQNVTYYEIEQEEPFFDQQTYHYVDFGVELAFTDKSLFYIVWNDKYRQFDIKFGVGSIGQDINLSQESSVKSYNLNEDKHWKHLIGRKVIGSKSYWNWWVEGNDTKKHYYPKDISIKFGDDEIVLFSCTSIENDNYLASADEISVFFDPKIAEKYSVGIIDYLRKIST